MLAPHKAKQDHPALTRAATYYQSGRRGLKDYFLAAAIPGVLSGAAATAGIDLATICFMNIAGSFVGGSIVMGSSMILGTGLIRNPNTIMNGIVNTCTYASAVTTGAFASAAGTNVFGPVITTGAAAAAVGIAGLTSYLAHRTDLQGQRGIFKRIFTSIVAGSALSAALTYGGSMLANDTPTPPVPEKRATALIPAN